MLRSSGLKNNTIKHTATSCSRPDLEDVMCFISNILGSGKLVLFLIGSISVNDVWQAPSVCYELRNVNGTLSNS
jgi:hypothetical protein